ncbi:response regulator transcription factor [Tropicimonas sp. TH_r6]|uniref:response regulator transcription factor n=1 Tax=Tropicimonas sp. TH_r6 TaxID=3082085 RepID=UPI002953B448|nr:response regulator transcription factor [Tropicimonas sp. TH_r6]MDV7141197.1 response regulator transcription factor [Tropicimonas sp. TH_r6]
MQAASNQILIIDDDPGIREVIAIALEDGGLRCRQASNGQAGLVELRRSPPDLVILDIGMPEMDGFETCRAIRRHSAVPILFLTARDEEINRILGFELGGDDYVTKPFSPRELVLRVKAILARANGALQREERLRHGVLEMVPERHHCTLDGQSVELTATEFQLLAALLRAGERVLTRDQLIQSVYGVSAQHSDRTVDSHIRNLRRKAAALGVPDLVATVHGVGLKLGTCRR